MRLAALQPLFRKSIASVMVGLALSVAVAIGMQSALEGVHQGHHIAQDLGHGRQHALPQLLVSDQSCLTCLLSRAGTCDVARKAPDIAPDTQVRLHLVSHARRTVTVPDRAHSARAPPAA